MTNTRNNTRDLILAALCLALAMLLPFLTGQIQTCREEMTKKDVLPEEMRIMSGKEEKDGT